MAFALHDIGLECDRPIGRSIYRQLKDVETVVIANNVMNLLRLDAISKVDVDIKNSLFMRQGLTKDFTIGPCDHTYAPCAGLQQTVSVLVQLHQFLAHRLVHETGNCNIEILRLE